MFSRAPSRAGFLPRALQRQTKRFDRSILLTIVFAKRTHFYIPSHKRSPQSPRDVDANSHGGGEPFPVPRAVWRRSNSCRTLYRPRSMVVS